MWLLLVNDNMTENNNFSISVFFPVYNDEKTIPQLVSKIIPILKSATDDFEVNLINDGSSDNSAKVIDELARKYDNVRTIHHEKNMGYGYVLRTGFYNAKKDLVFYTDGDGQYDVSELTKLLPLIKNVDIVNGYKIKRSDALYRIIAGDLYNWGAQILFHLKIRDVDCDYRLFRRHVFNKIKLESNSGVICLEMIKKLQHAGFKFKEVPVHHYPRVFGTSEFFNFKRIFKVLTSFGKLWIKFMIWQEYE